MPATQIDLLASPKSALNREHLESAGVPIRGEATRQEVRDYFLDVVPKKKLRENGLFWLFWGGHGHTTEALERRLILADASDLNAENLHLESLLGYLRGHSFAKLPRQIALIDTCADLRPHLAPPLAFHLGNALHPDCRQFIIFASGVGERAGNRNRVGVFSTAVLEALEKSSPAGPFPPNMDELTKGLIARFTDLCARGQSRQSPTTFRYRAWDSSEDVPFGEAPSPPAAGDLPPVIGFYSVPFPAIKPLLDALVACGVIKDYDKRQALIKDFRPEICSRIDHARDPWFHAKAIVERCLDISGGLEELVDRLEGNREAPANVARVQSCVKRILDRDW